jgi:hypothetical protein
MRNRTYITGRLLVWLFCLVRAIPLFACWQIGTGYSQVRTDHLIFGYANHSKPVRGAHFELHKAIWADGAADDQSNVPQGPARLPRWQKAVLHTGATNAMGNVDLGEVTPGKYYVVSLRNAKPLHGFPIEVLPRAQSQQSQTMWLNYFADGCSELLATEDGKQPAFTQK